MNLIDTVAFAALFPLLAGGQAATGPASVTGSEINFKWTNPTDTYGIFTMTAKPDSTPGTCQAIFTYSDKDSAYRDEQDIELLGASMLQSSNILAEGISLNNWNP